ncbi:LytTR family DNA-binding domain-containing protein [Polaribacter sp. HaHaR_3_91]|uniref:LytTR family DNA-binding domain-containing protein n=1 Tax=Polaribacter sp. HaHaR_3_91 TaxID=2745561 RepID=UPI001C4FC217|nr:LytTR family DNA-binding domain-containing protein [Polaribacter sp. HaHaR_3_91]QXP63783.1 LytTR family transcriptional regulator [Polaribacter sp. HaHaR_3_91]
MKKIRKWLSMPYYFNPSIKIKLKISFSLGLFIFIFLYIFRPFYLNLFEVILLEYTLAIGITAFISAFIILYVPPLIFKDYFNEDKWTIGRNLFLIVVSITIIGTIVWYFSDLYTRPYHLRRFSLLEFLFYTFLISLIPLTFFLFINEKNIRERREKKVLEIKEIKKEKEISKKLASEISITSDNGKETITFKIKNLVYITSQGNYASFFLLHNNNLKEKILRVTLTKITKELEEYTNIIRCHKSYIVNVNYITDISGNARGYLLGSKLIPIVIPVSRSFSKQSLQSLIQ